MSLIYLVPFIGILFLGMGVYIFTVNPNGPDFFRIGPMIADNNASLIQSRTGVNPNLVSDYTTGVVSIVAGSFFVGILPFAWIYGKLYPERLVKESEN